MKKKNKEEINEEQPNEIKDDVKQEVKTNEEIDNNKILLNNFVKNYKKTSGKDNAYAAGFRVWFTFKNEKNKFARHITSEWKKLFEDFLSSPVK